MPKDTKEKIAGYLAAHPYLNLATVSKDSTPLAHTVGYVSEGAEVFFITDKNSRKAQNILRNPNVAYTVDEDYESLANIQGVQIKGRAEIVTDQALAQKAMGMMALKFPYLKDLPPNPDYVCIRITPAEAVFIDNTEGFGHRENVRY